MAEYTCCPNCGSNSMDYVGNVIVNGMSVTHTTGSIVQQWGSSAPAGVGYSTINTTSTSFTPEALRLYRVPRYWPAWLVCGWAVVAWLVFYFILGMFQSPAGNDENWIANILIRSVWGFVSFVWNMWWAFLWSFITGVAYWLVMIPTNLRWKRNSRQYVDGIYCYNCGAVFTDGFLGTPEQFIQKIYSQP